MPKPKKKVKLHWLKMDKEFHPTNCVCGGTLVVMCERLYEQFRKKSK